MSPGGRPGRAGPDLTKIGAIRSGRDLLESIVFPSSTFAQGYDTFSVVTNDDNDVDGVIARQDAETLVLRDATGAERVFAKSAVKELRRRDRSLMPDGFDSVLQPAELRDLLAFLQSLR